MNTTIFAALEQQSAGSHWRIMYMYCSAHLTNQKKEILELNDNSILLPFKNITIHKYKGKNV